MWGAALGTLARQVAVTITTELVMQLESRASGSPEDLLNINHRKTYTPRRDGLLLPDFRNWLRLVREHFEI